MSSVSQKFFLFVANIIAYCVYFRNMRGTRRICRQKMQARQADILRFEGGLQTQTDRFNGILGCNSFNYKYM